MKTCAIIPARKASTRFPGKALALLRGKPLLQWVWEAVNSSGLFETVLIATEDPEIVSAAEHFGGKAVLTRANHPSGTDRICEVAAGLDYDVIVNVQGDEPLITREALSALLEVFSDPVVCMASLMTALIDPEELQNPNTVKVVTAQNSDALYFSRAPIPFDRDHVSFSGYKRHIGVYAYRKETLLQFVSLPQGLLEQVERLEQLRALENGIPIRMVETDYQGMGVDTPEDLAHLEVLLSGRI